MGLCPGMPHISIWPQLGSVWDDSTLETVRDLKIWRTLMMFGEVNSKLSSKYLFRWPGHFSLTTWTSNTSPEIVQLGQLYMLRISISCFFLIWLLNLLLNSGRLSDITGWCPKSLAKLVQMSLITRDYEIIFIVNPTNTTGGTTLHQLMVFQFFFPFVFPYNFDGRMCTGGADWCHHHGAYRSVLEHLEAGSNHPILMFSLLVLLYQLPKKMGG